MATLNAKEYKQFEDIKHTDENGVEFWYARELSLVLDYIQWRNFSKVIDKAMLSCQNSGFECADHFVEVSKIVDAGATTKPVIDYELSRYACYLIVQNGDPRKEPIALGQTYFAIQTRRQEIADAFNRLDEDNKRLVIRGEVTTWNAMLVEAAHEAGITDQLEYAQFQNAGYMGLYGGLTAADIHKRKNLKKAKKYSTTWVVRNWVQICSALHKPKQSSAESNHRDWKPQVVFTTKSVKLFEKPLQKMMARCRRIYLLPKKVLQKLAESN